MKDYTIHYKLNGQRLRLLLMYLPESNIWEVFIDSPIENTLSYRPNDTTHYTDIHPYTVDNINAENTYHKEEWSLDTEQFWNYALKHEMNIIYENGNEERWLSESTFHFNSDAGYFCIAEYMMSWIDDHIMLH